MNKKQKIIHFSILTFIIILTIGVRVYHIDTIPAGIYPDEANNGTNAFDAQFSGQYQWFYPDNNGREGLYINLIAIAFKLFGVSILTLKLPSIVLGVLTVVGVYLLSRELFISKPRLALIATYLTAVSFWAINFSRIAFRAITMLPVLTFSFFFLLRGLRTKKWYHFAIAGFIFGLGFHTYIAFRIGPMLLIVLFALLLMQQGMSFLKEQWRNGIFFIIFACISAVPIFYTFHIHPDYVSARTGDVSVFSDTKGGIVPTLTHSLILSLGKFNFYGDQNWRHGFPPYPTLEPFVGLMFAGGIILSTIIFITYFYKRFAHKTRNRKLVIHGLLLAWFVAFLAPEFLTTEGLPHSLRSIGVLPVVYIFAAFFINFLIERAKKHSHIIYAATSITLLLLLIFAGIFNIVKYHVFWARAPQQAQAFEKVFTDIAYYIPLLPENLKTRTSPVVGSPATREDFLPSA